MTMVLAWSKTKQKQKPRSLNIGINVFWCQRNIYVYIQRTWFLYLFCFWPGKYHGHRFFYLRCTLKWCNILTIHDPFYEIKYEKSKDTFGWLTSKFIGKNELFCAKFWAYLICVVTAFGHTSLHSTRLLICFDLRFYMTYFP